MIKIKNKSSFDGITMDGSIYDEPVAERRIVTTGKGSDYFGKCDQCGKHCSEHYKCQTKHSKGWTNGAYGHKECLKREFPEFVSHNTRGGNNEKR